MPLDLQDSVGRSRHHEFQTWRREHPNGLFLNLHTTRSALLHGSQCPHLGSTSWQPDVVNGSLTVNRKIAASLVAGLLAWATKNSVSVVPCRDCVRAKFVSSHSLQPAALFTRGMVAAVEGVTREVRILSRGRNSALRNEAVARANGMCSACGIDFRLILGGRGVCVLQVHHRLQLALSDLPRVTRLEDLAVLCANCHALIHSDRGQAITVEALRALLITRAAKPNPRLNRTRGLRPLAG
jgi:hypothetical protein